MAIDPRLLLLYDTAKELPFDHAMAVKNAKDFKHNHYVFNDCGENILNGTTYENYDVRGVTEYDKRYIMLYMLESDGFPLWQLYDCKYKKLIDFGDKTFKGATYWRMGLMTVTLKIDETYHYMDFILKDGSIDETIVDEYSLPNFSIGIHQLGNAKHKKVYTVNRIGDHVEHNRIRIYDFKTKKKLLDNTEYAHITNINHFPRYALLTKIDTLQHDVFDIKEGKLVDIKDIYSTIEKVHLQYHGTDRSGNRYLLDPYSFLPVRKIKNR